MRRNTFIGLMIILVLVVAFIRQREGRKAELVDAPEPEPAAAPRVRPPADSRYLVTQATPPFTNGLLLARHLNADTNAPQRDVQVLHDLVRRMLFILKERQRPPLGINEDFARVMTGGNRGRVVIIPPSHPACDARGRLVDRWGTPYHFHPRGPDAIDIRSAGPDARLFTSDDLVR